MINVTYIQHSSFLVELDRCLLLFDYFPAEAVPDVGFAGELPELPPEKHLYVFASHRHRDHFSLEVLRWQEERENITYILSKDIRLGKNYLARSGISLSVKDHIRFVSPLGHYEVDDLVIDTLRSTDEGVAFVITAEGQTIYHAGDLHWWNWGERGEIYCESIGRAYKKEINRLEDRHIDVAFVVLDPRMGDAYYLGMEYFLTHVDADWVFPMHLWRDYGLIRKLKRRPSLGRLSDKVVEMDGENVLWRR